MFPTQIDSLIAIYPEVSNLTSKHNLPLIIAGVCLAITIQWIFKYVSKTKFGKALIDGFKPVKPESEPIEKETEKKEK